MKNTMCFFYFLFSLTCTITLSAQDPYYINFSDKDGLPSNEVYDLEIDQNGLLWMTTDRGVCTYDGYGFTTYTTADGLADNTNFEIYRDSKNRLWFTGYNGKLSIYESGVFQPYLYNDSLLTILKKKRGGAFIGNLVENKNGSFYYTHNVNRRVEFFKLWIDDHFGMVNSIPYERDDDLLVSMPTDFKQLFFPHHFQHDTFPDFFPIRIGLKLKLKSNWLAYDSYSVFIQGPNGNRLESYDLKSLIDYTYIDHHENIWVATFNGLYCFKEGNLLKPPLHFFKEQIVTSIVPDKEGNYWVSTTQNGIYLVPNFAIKTEYVFGDEKEPYYSIGKLEKHIVLGSSGSRIASINRLNKKERVFEGNEKHQERQIRYLSKIDNSLYFEYYKIEEKDTRCKILTGFLNINSGIILLIPDQYIFVGTAFGYSLYLNKETSNDKAIYFTGVGDVNQRLTVTKLDNKNTIWFGTLEGLYKIENFQYKEYKSVLFNERDTFGRVNDIHFDKWDNRWIATIGNGLFYHTDDQLFQIKNTDGLNSNLVNHILVTNDSTLWVATNQGLNVFNYKFEKDTLVYSNIKSLRTVDGLSSNYINDVDYWNNEIWLATNDGICHFDPEIVNRFFSPVNVFIQELIVSDSTYTNFNDLLFKYNENDIFINFTGISFRKEKERPFYRYRLRSGDETPEWFYTNEKNIRYNDLDAGQYTFEVAAQNKSGEWNVQSTKLNFEIEAHFTETKMFRLFLFFLGLCIISLIFYFQNKRIRFRAKEKQRLQEAALRVREAELMALRNQMNPHFVFNSLNSIQNFIFKKDVEKANYFLSKFSSLMRDSLQYTRLDFISIKEELAFLNNYMELESMRFPEKFDFNVSVEEDLAIEYLLIPSLLLQPIMENAIKHAFKNIKHKGLLHVNVLQKDNDSIEVFIEDNGPGLIESEDTRPQHTSLGLKIIKNRIKLLNDGNYKKKSSVSFINLSTLDKNKRGLQVHFILPLVYKK